MHSFSGKQCFLSLVSSLNWRCQPAKLLLIYIYCLCAGHWKMLQTGSKWIPLGHTVSLLLQCHRSYCHRNCLCFFYHCCPSLSFSAFLLLLTLSNDYCCWCNNISNYCHVHECVIGVIGATIAPPITWNIGDIAISVCLRLHVITLMQFHVFLSACHLFSFPFFLSWQPYRTQFTS